MLGRRGRILFKQAIRTTIGRSVGAMPPLQKFMTRGLTAFAFHDVTDAPSHFVRQYGLAVSKDTFYRQVSWIAKNYCVVHPQSLIDEAPLPRRAALITFDDGYAGAFENGLHVLQDMQMPSIIFLNMRAVIERTPIVSALACYLDQYVSEFSAFAAGVGLSRPFHLALNPKLIDLFEERFGPVDQEAVLDYQGPFADLAMVEKWDDPQHVVYGNHLFEHWNASALTDREFEVQYRRNEMELSRLNNSVKLFAFTNGQPGSCYSTRDVHCASRLGATRVFSAVGGVNRDVTAFLLGRVSLEAGDRSADDLWFRIVRALLGERLHRKASLHSRDTMYL